MQFYSIIRYNLLWLLPDKWVPIERNVLPNHPTILLSLSLSRTSLTIPRVSFYPFTSNTDELFRFYIPEMFQR